MASDLARELKFAWRESTVRWTALLALAFASFSLLMGSVEVSNQRAEIARLAAAVQEEQNLALAGKTDPGDIAYGIFHLTYDPPSPLAFAALGLRNELAWKHKLRMLALEGQIHETDSENSELSLLGEFDFAYLVSILLPLFVIALLFDLDARERRSGRYELICSTGLHGASVLLVRALARILLLFVAIALPLTIFALVAGAPIGGSLLVLGIVLAHMLFWLAVCRLVTTRNLAGVTAALTLLSLWLLLSIVVPVVGKAAVERFVSVPNGGDILLTQRETVNDAWDLPKSATMTPFLNVHPEWTGYTDMDRPFEWKWYYAFQQVGDQTAKPLSSSLYQGMSRREHAMGWVAMLSPALAAERALTRLAETDVRQHLRYVRCAREFHASLRHFHYPLLFGQEPFSRAKMNELPEFKPCTA